VRILVAGGGIFGVTAALALRARGHDVTLVDPGPIPHPLAESTDISKVVRADYGADVDYTSMGERALDGWRAWNRAWPRPPFVETGVMFVARAPMAPGGFEHESYQLLARRGHALARLDGDAIADRFPAWRRGVHVDGYFNPSGGFARASYVVATLAQHAREQGVVIEQGRIDSLDHDRDLLLVCNGSWAASLVPELRGHLRAVGQPVFHLRPRDPSRADAFPDLIDAPIVFRRLCVYGDTRDEHFWIARHPARADVAVATGGSGHAFKFAPILGDLIADLIFEEGDPALAKKFRWRTDDDLRGEEAARHR